MKVREQHEDLKRRRDELKRELDKWHSKVFEQMKRIERRELRGKFEKAFEGSLGDPLELLVSWPLDGCEGTYSFIHCTGWRRCLKIGDLLDELYDTVEEYLSDLYDGNDLKIERRMDKMTDKKAVRLLGEDYLDELYPGCPHRGYCPEYQAWFSEKKEQEGDRD